jgi:hypothetical protein
MNFNKTSVRCTWRGSEFAYFPFLVMKSEMFAWSFSFVSCESSKWISLCFIKLVCLCMIVRWMCCTV